MPWGSVGKKIMQSSKNRIPVHSSFSFDDTRSSQISKRLKFDWKKHLQRQTFFDSDFEAFFLQILTIWVEFWESKNGPNLQKSVLEWLWNVFGISIRFWEQFWINLFNGLLSDFGRFGMDIRRYYIFFFEISGWTGFNETFQVEGLTWMIRVTMAAIGS